MILRVDWMKQFNPMIFYFVHATVKFHYGDLLIVLEGRETGNPIQLKGANNIKIVETETFH